MTGSTGVPALVYVGPTLTEQEILAVLPGAQVRPPIRRGDLYRDRTLRYSAFLMIDGVFHQQQALPPREIIDVLNDGAWVMGASSMGALRAAECWPAGMEGVGSIYRLFRRGSLGSEDEVAVSFDADDPQRSSVPLINIRYAVSRAVRRGQIDAFVGQRLVEVAVQAHYADRRWPLLLGGAGVHDTGRRLEGLLAAYDLKRKDAVAALGRVARRLEETPALTYQPRRSTKPFAPAEAYRERNHSALDGLPADIVKPALVRFVVAGGRHGLGGAEWAEDDNIVVERSVIDQIWDELDRSGDLDAEIFRWRAVHTASEQAQRAGLSPLPSHREAADHEIARRHGCDSWSELEEQLGTTSGLWTWVIGYREELAWAKCLRDALFRTGRR